MAIREGEIIRAQNSKGVVHTMTRAHFNVCRVRDGLVELGVDLGAVNTSEPDGIFEQRETSGVGIEVPLQPGQVNPVAPKRARR